MVLDGLGRFAGWAARDVFAVLVQAAPHVPMLHLQLGLACQQLGNFPEAIGEFQRAWQQPQMAYAALSLVHSVRVLIP